MLNADKVPTCLLQHVPTHACPDGSMVVEMPGGGTQPDPALATARLGRYVEELLLLLSQAGYSSTKAPQEDHRWGESSSSKLADANKVDVDISERDVRFDDPDLSLCLAALAALRCPLLRLPPPPACATATCHPRGYICHETPPDASRNGKPFFQVKKQMQ